MNNIVLVHGAFVDGSTWEGVCKILRRGCPKSHNIVGGRRGSYQASFLHGRTDLQFSSATAMEEPVITEAGNHPKVAGLAYIAAFAPDKGESVARKVKAANDRANVH